MWQSTGLAAETEDPTSPIADSKCRTQSANALARYTLVGFAHANNNYANDHEFVTFKSRRVPTGTGTECVDLEKRLAVLTCAKPCSITNSIILPSQARPFYAPSPRLRNML